MNQLIKNRKIFVFLAFIILTMCTIYYFRILPKSVDGWSDKIIPYESSRKMDDLVKLEFNDSEKSTSKKFNSVFKYFLRANINYKSKGGALVFYPGEVSNKGRYVNGIEGFARFFPMASSWMYSNNTDEISLDGKNVNIAELLKMGLLNGTSPGNTEFWGEVKNKDQRIVEAADIALGLWLSKEYIWNTLRETDKTQVINWLNSCVSKEIVDNNWNLFPITIVKCLEALGHVNQQNIEYINQLYSRYKKEHYIGNGWFDDPPNGLDYYNAWSIHYSLFWLDQIDPDFDPEFIRSSHKEFLEFYKYFFGPYGYPIMGRSVCYRLAAPTPIVSGSLINPEVVSKGLAKRTLEQTWKHFINKNSLKDGKFTQGYYEDDYGLLDGYSGAGSCLWSLRSLIVAYYVDKKISLYDSEDELLPVERKNYSITNNTIGWSIYGDSLSKTIILKIESNKNNQIHKLINYDRIDQIKESIFKRPFRPNNKKALYKNYEYSSRADVIINN
ncbi:DUF2264 domain-containing protein [Winogradskyella alexanderae]|uniref:DUF2264 domain-containing protein n=1 Tax=Winogradskyella alexanderae TaxID=2877123 RepID=A0ABS7XRP2_9FLAO|nr:DUF2264 domain-containing protein [Winogradskyella alexanderae]MCA0132692.1 DUF2264 domain-containing protein [Winogradskyella alexanderae]